MSKFLDEYLFQWKQGILLMGQLHVLESNKTTDSSTTLKGEQHGSNFPPCIAYWHNIWASLKKTQNGPKTMNYSLAIMQGSLRQQYYMGGGAPQ